MARDHPVLFGHLVLNRVGEIGEGAVEHGKELFDTLSSRERTGRGRVIQAVVVGVGLEQDGRLLVEREEGVWHARRLRDVVACAHHSYREEEPTYLGHLMVRTKRHVPGLAELTEAEGQALGLAVARLSHALKTCTGAEKVYAEAYYEVVQHVHLLLTARYPGTPPEFWRWKIGEWPAAPKGAAKEVTALCDRLRAYLSP